VAGQSARAIVTTCWMLVTMRRRRRFFATTIVLIVAVVAAAQAHASELTLSREALQALVASQLFEDGGRWHLQRGACHAYLERPVVALSAGRLIVNAHLSAKLGFEASGSCVGVDLASNVALSGIPRGSGSELSVQDIRVDRADDDSTRQALELLLGVASDAVSRALKIDLMTVVKPTAVPGLPMPARVTRLVITDVVTGQRSVTVRFDLGVAIP
jgi:hypothetical protein